MLNSFRGSPVSFLPSFSIQPCVAPLNSQTLYPQQGPQTTWIACSDTCCLWRRSWTWPIACHTSLSVLTDTKVTYYCLFESSHHSSDTLHSLSFSDPLSVATPQLSYFGREAHAEGPRDRFYFMLRKSSVIYLISKWMGKWMFLENVHKNTFPSMFGMKETKMILCVAGDIYWNVGRHMNIGLRTPWWAPKSVFSWSLSPSASHCCW